VSDARKPGDQLTDEGIGAIADQYGLARPVPARACGGAGPLRRPRVPGGPVPSRRSRLSWQRGKHCIFPASPAGCRPCMAHATRCATFWRYNNAGML